MRATFYLVLLKAIIKLVHFYKPTKEHPYTNSLFIVRPLTAWTGIDKIESVRRHINWNTQRPDLREDLAHLVDNIKRRVCGIASAGSPSFSV